LEAEAIMLSMGAPDPQSKNRSQYCQASTRAQNTQLMAPPNVRPPFARST